MSVGEYYEWIKDIPAGQAALLANEWERAAGRKFVPPPEVNAFFGKMVAVRGGFPIGLKKGCRRKAGFFFPDGADCADAFCEAVFRALKVRPKGVKMRMFALGGRYAFALEKDGVLLSARMSAMGRGSTIDRGAPIWEKDF